MIMPSATYLTVRLFKLKNSMPEIIFGTRGYAKNG
jgi:hypothetical protein